MGKKAEATAIATADDKAAAFLAEVGPDFDLTGGEGSDGGFDGETNISLPAVVFNEPGYHGQFFNKLTEEASDTMDVVFLYAKEYRELSTYDEATNTATKVCSSSDRITGTIEDTGETRPCKTCPHRKWTTVDGKRKPPACSEVWAATAMDMADGQVVLMRFRRSSIGAFNLMKRRYHENVKIGGKLYRRILLHLRRYTMRLEQSENKKYYLPVIEPHPDLFVPGDMVEEIREFSAVIAENIDEILRFNADAEPDTEAPSADADYAGEGGEGFE